MIVKGVDIEGPFHFKRPFLEFHHPPAISGCAFWENYKWLVETLLCIKNPLVYDVLHIFTLLFVLSVKKDGLVHFGVESDNGHSAYRYFREEAGVLFD